MGAVATLLRSSLLYLLFLLLIAHAEPVFNDNEYPIFREARLAAMAKRLEEPRYFDYANAANDVDPLIKRAVMRLGKRAVMRLGKRCMAPPVGGEAVKVLCVRFNQDNGCFACGTSDGFLVYNADPLTLIASRSFRGAVAQVEMLFRCQYLALVGGGCQPAFPTNHVVIWDGKRDTSLFDLEMNGEVRAVRLRRDRIVVFLEGRLHLYAFLTDLRLLLCLDTAPNPLGLASLCPSSSRPILAFPYSDPGSVCFLDLTNTDAVPKTIKAHKTHLVALTLNGRGEQMATSSTRGTMIRVFDVDTQTLLAELRRGSLPAKISSLSFSPDSTMICVTSDHSTVHVFKLKEGSGEEKTREKLFLRGRVSVGRFRFRVEGQKRAPICAFGQNNSHVFVCCTDGSFYKFEFDMTTGSCTQLTSGEFNRLPSEATILPSMGDVA